MDKLKWPLGLWFFLAVFLTNSSSEGLFAQTPASQSVDFELHEGDRVVLLGNSLFENDLQYNYIEYLLTTRFPGRNIAFRNLGWSGDTVFGEARSYYTSPPSSYDLLIQQLTDARPTLVFLAYGANEAVEGEEGIGQFKKGLNQLLDTIQGLGARAVLLSTIPQVAVGLAVDLEGRNQNLERYSHAIKEVAADRQADYIDVYTPFQEQAQAAGFTEDGVHLNDRGYFYLASVLAQSLGLSVPEWKVAINVADQQFESAVPSSKVHLAKDKVQFQLEEDYLPFLYFEGLPQNEEGSRILKVQGLKRGYYSLHINGVEVASASAKTWAEGVKLSQGPPITNALQLRELIDKKNETFFHQYRPQNRTYIIGFRAYEQGRHKEGLRELGVIVEWLEGRIQTMRKPQPTIYSLSLIK